MPTIDARRGHRLPVQEARRRAEELAHGLEALLGLRWHWDGDRIRFHAPGGVARGTRGELGIGVAEVRLQIELPPLLRLLRRGIESRVREQLERALCEA